MAIGGNPNYGPGLPVIGDKVITLLCKNIISLYLRIIAILHLGQKSDNSYPIIQFWENFLVKVNFGQIAVSLLGKKHPIMVDDFGFPGLEVLSHFRVVKLRVVVGHNYLDLLVY